MPQTSIISCFLLLVHLRNSLESNSEPYIDTIGLLSLAAMAESGGFSCKVWTGDAHQFAEFLMSQQPQIEFKAIGFYVDYDNQSSVIPLVQLVRSLFPCVVLAGGPQARWVDPEVWLVSGIDVLVFGEAESRMVPILTALQGDGSMYADIPCIAYRKADGSIHYTGGDALMPNLNELPPPRFDLLLSRSPFRPRLIAVSTSRGCPYNCRFCTSGSSRSPVRYKAVSTVLQEIETWLNSSDALPYVVFADDTLTSDLGRLVELCHGLGELRNTYGLGFFAEAHIGFLKKHPEAIPLLVAAGCHRLRLGIESGSQPVLDAYRKGIVTGSIRGIIEGCYKSGLPLVIANFIVGGALESAKTAKSSVALALDLMGCAPGMFEPQAGFWAPYPGTLVAQEPARFDLRMLDKDSLTSRHSMSDYCINATACLNKTEICSIREQFINRIWLKAQDLISEVSFDRCFAHYDALSRFRIDSLWRRVMSVDPVTHQYFTMLAERRALPSWAIQPCDFPDWRPYRTIELSAQYSMHCASEYRMNPHEFRVMELCAGKLTVRDMAILLMTERVLSSCNETSGINELKTILSHLEKQRLLVYRHF